MKAFDTDIPKFLPRNIVSLFIFLPVGYDNGNFPTLFPTLGCSFFSPPLIPKIVHAHIKNKQRKNKEQSNSIDLQRENKQRLLPPLHVFP